MDVPLVSIVLWLPLLGVGVLLCLGREREKLLKGTALAVTLAECVFCLVLYVLFQSDSGTMQFTEHLDWIPWLGIAYRVGLDGLSLWLVLLTALLGVIALLAAWEEGQVRLKQCLVGVLLLETAVIGMFTALDAALFCVFCEGALIPMGWLMAIGAKPDRRSAAALKGVVFWLAGSVVMLLAFLYCWAYHRQVTGVYSFDLLAWQSLTLPYPAQVGLLCALGLAFALRVPLVPLHTWLGDAQCTSRPVGSVLLAGVFLNAGAYGFMRFVLPLAPAAASSFPAVTVFSVLALIGIIYGALLMIGHSDMRKVVAYFSLTQMGFVMLGLFSFNRYGITGSAFLLVSQGLVAAALAIVVRMQSPQGDLHCLGEGSGTQTLPRSGTLFLIVVCACIGLPGLSTFVGMFLVLLGVFRANPLYAVFAALGSILTAAAMVRIWRQLMVEETSEAQPTAFRSLKARELLTLVPLVLLIVWMGIYPAFFLKPLEVPVRSLMLRLEGHSARVVDLGGPGASPRGKATLPHRGERTMP